jgi:riboflavin synthase
VFTGLIQAVGTIAAREERDGVLRLTISAPTMAPKLAVGDSIAVSGVCLTLCRAMWMRPAPCWRWSA